MTPIVPIVPIVLGHTVAPAPTDIGSTASAVALAAELADLLGEPLNMTWWSLCNVPVNMTHLLDSPQGWSALAGYVACDLGAPDPEYRPRVH